MYSGHFSSCVHGCVSVSLTIQGFSYPVIFGVSDFSSYSKEEANKEGEGVLLIVSRKPSSKKAECA